MNKNAFLLIVFILMALAQLFVPAKMIINREDVLHNGRAFKFKTAPIDPADPFRGKYVHLEFDEQSLEVNDGEDWLPGESIYVTPLQDDYGFTSVHNPSKEKPTEGQDYLIVKVRSTHSDKINQIVVDLPFDRLYLEESKASGAEQIYRESQLDSAQSTYALVYVKDGEAVLADVMINGISISEIVKAQLEEEAVKAK